MAKEYEIVRHQGDATVYRLVGGRAEVMIYDKAAVTQEEIVEQCRAAEQDLIQGKVAYLGEISRGHRWLEEPPLPCATDAAGTHVGPLIVHETSLGVMVQRGPVSISIHDGELGALIDAAHHRLVATSKSLPWCRPYEKFLGCSGGIAIGGSADAWVLVPDEKCKFVGESLLSRDRQWSARKKVADLEAALEEAKKEANRVEGSP